MRSPVTAALLALAGILHVGPAGVANAETVLLARGDDTFGQGWLFLDAAGQCRVVTPRHVLETADGALSPPDLIDRYGRIHPTHSPVAATDPDLDLAFITVGGQLAKGGCSRDRVRATPLQPIIDSLKQAQLDVSTQTERQSIAVAVRAVSRDDKGGGIIAVSSVDPNVSFQKGMSGGTITHNGRPIAMLFEVDSDEGIGVAMRYDLIADELQKLVAKPQDKPSTDLTSVNDLVLVRGRITERGSGLSGFLAGTSSLKVAPAPDRVVLTFANESQATVEAIHVRGKGLTGKGFLIVETEKDQSGFLPGARCALVENTTCNMAPRRATRLRVTMTGVSTDAYEIEGLDLVESGR